MSNNPDNPDAADPSRDVGPREFTARMEAYQHGLDQRIDMGMTMSQLMEKYGLETQIDLSASDVPMSDPLLPSRDRTGSRYEIVELLAEGGMGSVLRSMDSDLRRNVAMKVIVQSKRQHSETMVRFVEEAQITGQLEHPNIIPVHELGVDAHENLFYTMKLIRGFNLMEILDGIEGGRQEVVEKYNLSQLLNIFLKVCDAVAFAHSKGVVHRDLKPQNIMIGNFGEVLVLDWGIAKILPPDYEAHQEYEPADGDNETAQAIGRILSQRKKSKLRKEASKQERLTRIVDSIRLDEGTDTAKTLDGQIMGSPGFMAPEQAYGDVREIDHRTDIYSLGAILFNILSLHQHVEGDDVHEILKALVSGPTETPIEAVRRKSKAGKTVKLPHCPGGKIPHALSYVAMKALETKKRNRYQEVELLQKDILAYLGGYATTAETVSPVKKCLLFIRRHRVTSMALFTAMVLAVVALYPIILENSSLSTELAAAHTRFASFEGERMQLARVERSGRIARETAEDLAQSITQWQWEQADRKARYLTEDSEVNALILPPGQLMSLAHLQLFHGDIDQAVWLLELLRGSSLKEASRALVAELTTGSTPIGLPGDSTEWMTLSKQMCNLPYEDARLAAECLLAGAIKLSTEQDQDRRAMDLAIALMRQTSDEPGRLKITIGGGGSGLTITQGKPEAIRLEPLCWLPVEHLDLRACPDLDISALKNMPQLKSLRVGQSVQGLSALRDLKLERIGFDELLPANEFWRQQGL